MKYLRDITIPDPLVVSYIVEWMGCENIPFVLARSNSQSENLLQ
jgi:hypothetical protein